MSSRKRRYWSRREVASGLEDRISARQAGAWGFCALSVPAVLTCAKLGWGWVLLGCAIAAVYFYLTGQLPGRKSDLAELTMQAFGRTAGSIVLAVGWGFAVLAAAQTAARAGTAFPDETTALAGPAVLALAAMANEKGARQAARVCGASALILAGLYTITICSAAQQVKPRWLAPWGSGRQTLEVLPAMLSLTCLRFLPRKETGMKCGWWALLVLGPAAVSMITAGCLSPRLTQQLAQPFYTVSQSLSVLSVMERFEPLVSAALLIGFFAMESLLLAAARAQIIAAFPKLREKRWVSWALGASALALMFLSREIGQAAWALGAAVFWGITPLLTQLIVAIK